MKTRKKKATLLTVGILVIAMVLAGCGGAKDSKTDKTLVLGTRGYFSNDNWDPASGWNSMLIQSYGVAETLFKLDDSYKAEPWLAKSAEQKESDLWEISLRDKVTYHNGKEMTGDSVKKAFERTLAENPRAKDLLKIKEITAEGQTLKIATEGEVPTLKNDLADPAWVVYDAESKEDFKEKTYYTGPFVPESFEPNSKIVTKRYDKYWGEKPNIEKAVFKTYGDDDALLMALQSGEIDVMIPVSVANFKVLKDDNKFGIDNATSTRGCFLQLNLEKPVFKDKAVRQAISLAIDRESYVKSICYGRDTAAYTIFPDSLECGGTKDLNLEVTKKDIKKAKELLSDAGYKDTNGNGILDKAGEELEFRVTTFSSYTSALQLYEVLQETLKGIGIKMDIQAIENPNDYVKSGNFFAKGASYLTAPTGTSPYFFNMLCKSSGDQNYGHYKNQEVDNLIEELGKTSDSKKRDEISRKISELVTNDCGFIFYSHEKFTAAYNKDKLEIFKAHPSELYIVDSSVKLK